MAAVFCVPTINVFAMMTLMDLSNGALGNCTILDTSVGSNNVTGSPLTGQVFNLWVSSSHCIRHMTLVPNHGWLFAQGGVQSVQQCVHRSQGSV